MRLHTHITFYVTLYKTCEYNSGPYSFLTARLYEKVWKWRWQKAIPSKYVDLLSQMFCSILLGTTAQGLLMNLMCSEFILLKLLPHLTGDNEPNGGACNTIWWMRHVCGIHLLLLRKSVSLTHRGRGKWLQTTFLNALSWKLIHYESYFTELGIC